MGPVDLSLIVLSLVSTPSLASWATSAIGWGTRGIVECFNCSTKNIRTIGDWFSDFLSPLSFNVLSVVCVAKLGH